MVNHTKYEKIYKSLSDQDGKLYIARVQAIGMKFDEKIQLTWKNYTSYFLRKKNMHGYIHASSLANSSFLMTKCMVRAHEI